MKTVTQFSCFDFISIVSPIFTQVTTLRAVVEELVAFLPFEDWIAVLNWTKRHGHTMNCLRGGVSKEAPLSRLPH